MKKLMTMIAAVATAFGLYADAPVNPDAGFKDGTGFETADVSDENYSAGDLSTGGAWTVNDTENKCTVVEGSKGYEGGVPLAYSEASTDNQYLSIKTALTAGKELVRTVGEDINDGLYYDSLVSFTAFDAEDVPPADDDAKLAVWLKDNETSTNLMVRANSADGVRDYECSVYGITDFSGWHRLTIKAIGNVGGNASGFVVFVDGVPATCTSITGLPTTLTPQANEWATQHALFPAIANVTAIASVAFLGQGSVDDIAITATAPDFAKDANFITVTVGAYVLSYKGPDGETYDSGSQSFKLEGAATTITITDIKYDETKYGPASKEIGADTTIMFEGTAAASFAGVGYQYLTGDVNSAVAAANDATDDGTIKLFEDATTAIEIDNKVENVIITLDLNDHAIRVNGDDPAISVLEDVSVVVSNGTITAEQVAYNEGTLVIEDGTYDGEFAGEGTLKINGGLFSDESAKNAADIPGTKYWAKNGDNYWYLEDKIDAADATLELKETEATYVDGLNFPEETVKLDDAILVKGPDYTIEWDPATIAEMKAGDQDKVYTITINFANKYIAPATALTKTFTVKAPAPSTVDLTINATGYDENNKIYYTIGGVTTEIVAAQTVVPVEPNTIVNISAELADWHKVTGTGDVTVDAEKSVTVTVTELDPEQPITPQDAGITDGAFKDASSATIQKVVGWAKENGITTKDVNGIQFDADGDPNSDLGEAYLLNCSVDELDDAKAAFKFPSITPGTVPSIEGDYNVTPQYKGADAVTGPWTETATTEHSFYKAFLRYVPEN